MSGRKTSWLIALRFFGKMKRQYEAAKLSSAENYVASLSAYLTLLIDLVLIMTTRTKAAFKT